MAIRWGASSRSIAGACTVLAIVIAACSVPMASGDEAGGADGADGAVRREIDRSSAGDDPVVHPGEFLLRPSGGDDTAALVAAVADHPAVVIDRPLRIDGVAKITASDRVISFRGTGALERWVRPEVVTHQVLWFVGTRNITLNRPVVRGPNPRCDAYDARYEEQHAIALEGVDGFTINGGDLSGMPGDGVFIFYNRELRVAQSPSRNVTVNDVSIRCTGRSSISNVSSENVTVNRGSYDRAGRWTFNVEPFNTRYVQDFSINQPWVGSSRSRWLYVGGPNYRCGTTRVSGMVVTGARIDPRANAASVIGCADVRILP